MTAGRALLPLPTAWRSLRMSEQIRRIVERTDRSHIGLPSSGASKIPITVPRGSPVR